MIKQTQLKTPLVIAFAALMLSLPTAQLNAGPIDVNQIATKGSNQSEAPRLMAQVTEERRSVTTSTTEAPPPTEEYRSVTTSTSSTKEAPPPTEERRSVTSSTSSTKEAPPVQKPNCADQCRGQFDRSMTECNQPGHPDRKDCEEWAGDREKECLEKCYRK